MKNVRELVILQKLTVLILLAILRQLYIARDVAGLVNYPPNKVCSGRAAMCAKFVILVLMLVVSAPAANAIRWADSSPERLNMIKDGKYKLRKDGQEYDAVVSTLMEGQYPDKGERQFVCIPGHFPIPLDSWLLEDFVMLPVEPPNNASSGLVDGRTEKPAKVTKSKKLCQR